VTLRTIQWICVITNNKHQMHAGVFTNVRRTLSFCYERTYRDRQQNMCKALPWSVISISYLTADWFLSSF